MTARDPSFAIPGRPERRFPRGGGVEYEGETVFVCTPEADRSDGELESLVADVLDADAYRSGDFMELPMPLYLVRDEGTADVFRVTVRNRAVQLHVLPETESEGLRRFYDRLVEVSDCEWSVACRTDFG
ncbi:hypothetical protein [Halosimplex marinum]|uniref:hypothetical protein n=1 Tax=Halosimplex marinum TaxID=3396620 RepID=UPI003F5654D5